MIGKLLRWHRFLALTFSIPLIIYAVSGLLHPIMVHFFSSPKANLANTSFNAVIPHHYISLFTVLTKAKIDHFSSVRLVEFGGDVYYQIRIKTADQSISPYVAAQPNPHFRHRYFSLITGNELTSADGDLLYAQSLANKLDHSSVVDSQLITHFTSVYTDINRILPVYRLRLASGNIFYIDPHGSRVAATSNSSREAISQVFSWLHRQTYLGEKHDPLRIIFVSFFIIGLLLLALSGLLLYGVLWSKYKHYALTQSVKQQAKQPIQAATKKANPNNLTKKPYFSRHKISKIHRVTGLIVSVSLLGFTTSGIHTLMAKFDLANHFAISPNNDLSRSMLHYDPVAIMLEQDADNFNLVNWNHGLWLQLWRYQNNQLRLNYWHPSQGEKTDKQYAIYLAEHRLSINVLPDSVEAKTHFDSKYSPIFKRLPVQLLKYIQPQQQIAIETHTGYVAQLIEPHNVWQGIHFSLLHKYHFLNSLGKPNRDLIISLIMIGILLTASLGLWMYFLRLRRIKKG